MRHLDFPPDQKSDLEQYAERKDDLLELFAENLLARQQGVDIRATDFAQADFVEANQEKIAELVALIKLIQDKLYPILLTELHKAHLSTDEEDLRKNFLSREFFDRAEVYFREATGVEGERDEKGTYSDETHMVKVRYNRMIDQNGKLNLTTLVRTLCHEYIHFISEHKATHFVHVEPDGQLHFWPASVGRVHYIGYHTHNIDKFRELNESVTEEYARDLLPGLLDAVEQAKPELDNLTLSDIRDDYEPYQDYRIIFNYLLDCITEYVNRYAKVDRSLIRDAFKRGLLQGEVLSNEDVRLGLKECFGEDVFHNFLNSFTEKNPGYQMAGDQKKLENRLNALRARWEANGGKGA